MRAVDIMNERSGIIKNIIRENYNNKDFNIEMLAQWINLSTSYCRDIICRDFGMPPQHLIETFRLEKAIDLIQNGNKIYKIAVKVGYGSYHSFRFAFKKRVGISPHKFKESLDNQLNDSDELINDTKKKLWIS